MNELIMPHNPGVKRVLESMKEVLTLYKSFTGNYRPLLDGERYLTDREVAEILKVSRRALQEYRNDSILPYNKIVFCYLGLHFVHSKIVTRHKK